MSKFSFKVLFKGLYKLFRSSPSAIIFLILGIIFLIAIIIIVKKHKKIEKPILIIGWLFVIVFVLIKFFTSINIMLDNFINNVFMQIFFPNLATYFIIIMVSNLALIFNILNKNSKTWDKLINAIFYIIITILLLLILEQISANNINIYEKFAVYNNQNLQILIESSTLVFLFWMLILFSKHIIRILIEKSDEYKTKHTKQSLQQNIEPIEQTEPSVNSQPMSELNPNPIPNLEIPIPSNFEPSMTADSIVPTTPITNTTTPVQTIYEPPTIPVNTTSTSQVVTPMSVNSQPTTPITNTTTPIQTIYEPPTTPVNTVTTPQIVTPMSVNNQPTIPMESRTSSLPTIPPASINNQQTIFAETKPN